MKKLLSIVCFAILVNGCAYEPKQQESDSGVQKASTLVKTDQNGHTAEQVNIMERLKRDNEVGSIKHLYIISAYTGDVLQYSSVKAKVTSGNKRLSPTTVNNGVGASIASVYLNTVTLGGVAYATDEVLDDGGAYGNSGTYLFWFDAQGNYHQYYPSGGTYLHISDKPLRVKKANFSVTIE